MSKRVDRIRAAIDADKKPKADDLPKPFMYPRDYLPAWRNAFAFDATSTKLADKLASERAFDDDEESDDDEVERPRGRMKKRK